MQFPCYHDRESSCGFEVLASPLWHLLLVRQTRGMMTRVIWFNFRAFCTALPRVLQELRQKRAFCPARSRVLQEFNL